MIQKAESRNQKPKPGKQKTESKNQKAENWKQKNTTKNLRLMLIQRNIGCLSCNEVRLTKTYFLTRKIWIILRLYFRLKMFKHFFRKNSSIFLVQSRFIFIKYGEGWSMYMVRRAGLDRGEGQIHCEGKPEHFWFVTNLIHNVKLLIPSR